jgi:hypothetical protein
MMIAVCPGKQLRFCPWLHLEILLLFPLTCHQMMETAYLNKMARVARHAAIAALFVAI